MQAILKISFLASFLFFSHFLLAQQPPYGGTIFLDPNIIIEDDPTTFDTLTIAGRGMRTMYDRRVNDWVNENAYLFIATYDDGLSLEIQVNPEFGSEELALKEAEKYAPILGQLPSVLRKDAQTVWIHKGVQPFGGGNNNFLIHTGQTALYERDGILEETLVHEGSHTSLDNPHANSMGWLDAQKADPSFISTYARDNPTREDIAESFLPYLMIRYRSGRMDPNMVKVITETMPNRIAYFDEQNLNMFPISTVSSTIELQQLSSSLSVWPNPVTKNGFIEYKLPKRSQVAIDIINLQGSQQLLLQESVLQESGRQQLSFVMKHKLSAGLYLIRLQTGFGSVVKKIIIP